MTSQGCLATMHLVAMVPQLCPFRFHIETGMGRVALVTGLFASTQDGDVVTSQVVAMVTR